MIELTSARLSIFGTVDASGHVPWVLWVQQDGQRDRADRLFAGRVKFQDDPVASTYAVLQDALEQLEAALGIPAEDPLF